VDLPRLAIPATTPEALVSHWAGKQKWTPDFQSTIQSKLTPLLNKESSGACHAEAGLIASLISHVGKTQGGLVSGDARDVNDDGTAGEVEEERVVDGDVRNVDDDDVTAGEVEEGKMEGRMADVRDVDEEEEEPAEPEELTTAFQKMFPEVILFIYWVASLSYFCCFYSLRGLRQLPSRLGWLKNAALSVVCWLNWRRND
jgi:hypothetical protein